MYYYNLVLLLRLYEENGDFLIVFGYLLEVGIFGGLLYLVFGVVCFCFVWYCCLFVFV